MGRAIQVTDLSFTTNLGKITIISGGDIPEVIEISGINIVGKEIGRASCRERV